jgi:hypothetical protein
VSIVARLPLVDDLASSHFVNVQDHVAPVHDSLVHNDKGADHEGFIAPRLWCGSAQGGMPSLLPFQRRPIPPAEIGSCLVAALEELQQRPIGR